MLEDIKVNKDKYYTVGYCPYLKQYMLAITITWVAWYERYYSISEDEYKWFDSDIDKLNHLVDELLPFGRRLILVLCFQKGIIENNSFQSKLINKVLSQKDLIKNP